MPDATTPQSLLQSLGYQYGGIGAIPQIQRSQYLADALQNINATSAQNIRSPMALGSNLLAEAILRFSQNRSNKQMEQAIAQGMQGQGQFATIGTGLPGDPNTGQPTQAPPQDTGQIGGAQTAPPAPPQASAPQAPAGGFASQPSAQASALAAIISAPRNNPGNLRPLPNGQMWNGQTGVQNGFDVFGSPQAGDRAAGLNLENQQRLHGLNTLNEIIPKWAPPGDGANNPAAYVQRVSQITGYDPDQRLDLTDPGTLNRVKMAMYTVEGAGGRSVPQGPAPQAQPYQVASTAALPPGPPQAPQPQAGPINAMTPPPIAQAMQAQQGPPTGLKATPQEVAIYQNAMRFPVGSAQWQQGMELAHTIQQRAATPLAPPKDMMWNGSSFAPMPGTQYTQLPAPAPGVTSERAPFGQVTNTAIPNAVQDRQLYDPTSGSYKPLQGLQSQVSGQFTPGSVVSTPPGGAPSVVQGPVFDPEKARSAFAGDPAVADAVKTTRAAQGFYNAVSNAVGKNNGVLGNTAVDTLIQSYGLTPRGATAQDVVKAMGFPEAIQSQMLRLVGPGGMTVDSMRQITSVISSEVQAAHDAAVRRMSSDTAAGGQAYAKGVPGEAELIPPVPTMPSFKAFGGGGAQGPSGESPQQLLQDARGAILRGAPRAAVAERLQRMGVNPAAL